MSLERMTLGEHLRDPARRQWRVRRYMEPIRKDTMEKSARYAEKQSTTSEDVTNAQTADGANVNDILEEDE